MRKVGHLTALDGLRGIAATYVLCHHFLYWNVQGVPALVTRAVSWAGFGHFMVSVFIVLSGFSLGLQPAGTPDLTLRGGFRGYVWRRGRRILLGYYAALGFGILATWLGGGKVTGPDILVHLLLLQNWFPEYSLSLNMTLWSVATEWQIYFLLPSVFLPIWQRWGIGATVLSGFVVGVLPLVLFPSHGPFDHACPWYAGLFTLGILGAHLVSRTAFLEKTAVARLLGCLGVTVGLYLATKGMHLGERQVGRMSLSWAMDLIAGGISLALVLVLCAAQESGRAQGFVKFFSHPVTLALGRFSYSIYLIHAVVLSVCLIVSRQYLKLAPLGEFTLRSVVGIPVALIVSYGFYWAFERPCLTPRSKSG